MYRAPRLARCLPVAALLLVCAFFPSALSSADQPCAVRSAGESVVCVCNATYCDTVTRELPSPGTYVTYSSSKEGQRFEKSTGKIDNSGTVARGAVVLEVDISTRFQEILGFGGAVTDSAGINWRSLSEPAQKNLINSYCSTKGLEYSMIRVPIGGSDFSTRAYAYNEQPVNDRALSNYTLSEEDYLYKIPMIKACMGSAPVPVHVLASAWSPPVWMKNNGKFTGFSRLKPEYYQTYADYHLRFLEKYSAAGVNVWGITTTNEPVNGVVPLIRFNSLGWMPDEQALWLVDNLGPTIRKSQFNSTKILAVDDQRYTLPAWINAMVKKSKSVLDYVDGIAVHWYGDFMPASFITSTKEQYPDKFILGTEACEGSKPWQFKKVDLGSWSRAENYIMDIIQDLNSFMVGWIDWNLCVNSVGGPNWAKNFVDSTIIVFREQDEFVKQPMFYAMGHFSKFVPRGSQRISVNQNSSPVENVAFKTPQGTVVIILYNKKWTHSVLLRLPNNKTITVIMPAKTVKTLEISIE